MVLWSNKKLNLIENNINITNNFYNYSISSQFFIQGTPCTVDNRVRIKQKKWQYPRTLFFKKNPLGIRLIDITN